MSKRGSKRDGFTFIEIMVAMTILAVVLTVTSAIYLSGHQHFFREGERVEVQENLRLALGKMSRGLRQARAGEVKVCDQQGQESLDRKGPWIVFSTPEGSTSGYRLDAQEEEIEEKLPGGTGDWQPLASNITYLHFEYDPASKEVRIVARGEKGKSGPIELSTMVYLRVP